MPQTTAAKVVVRDAVLADAPLIAEFNQRLAVESEGKQIDDEILQRGVRRALNSPEQCRYFIAELGGRVIGQTMITLELTDWRDGVIWWLQSVYVVAEHRRAGVFKALFAHVRAAADQAGDVRAIRLYVEQANHRAMNVYRSVGMKDAGYYVYEIDWSSAVKKKA